MFYLLSRRVKEALQQVKGNKGSAKVDGITVNQLTDVGASVRFDFRCQTFDHAHRIEIDDCDFLLTPIQCVHLSVSGVFETSAAGQPSNGPHHQLDSRSMMYMIPRPG
jgi:hypothetical protein